MTTKLTFATGLQEQATILAQSASVVEDLVAIYFDRGYNSAGSDPIIDADVTSLNIAAADVAAFITLAQQFANFLNNAAVTTGDYDATLNNIRSDI